MLDARAAVQEADRLVREPAHHTEVALQAALATLAPRRVFTAEEVADDGGPLYTRADRDALEEYNAAVMARSRERMTQWLAAQKRERGGTAMTTKTETQVGPSGKYNGAAAGTILAQTEALDFGDDPERYRVDVRVNCDGAMPMFGDPDDGLALIDLVHEDSAGLIVHRWHMRVSRSDETNIPGSVFAEGDRVRAVLTRDYTDLISIGIEVRELIARPRTVD